MKSIKIEADDRCVCGGFYDESTLGIGPCNLLQNFIFFWLILNDHFWLLVDSELPLLVDSEWPLLAFGWFWMTTFGLFSTYIEF